MSTFTAWVKSASEQSGLDHLGVQAPCIHMYGRLLPGITNVTDRARYYSFYPWFFWACEQSERYAKRDWDWLVNLFRRADCLFTLIAARHTRTTDKDDYKHGIAMVGREKLLPALTELESGSSLRLSTFAARDSDSPERYFKNKLGGLGQYYIGTLVNLGILEGNARTGIRYTIERASVFAEAMDASVDRSLFFETMKKDVVTLEVLDALVPFCPCQLPRNRKEQEVFLDLFFDRKSIYGVEGKQRSSTLVLLLHLIRRFEEIYGADADDVDHLTFRGCVYSDFLPDKKDWSIPESLQTTRKLWSIYQRNELLSISVQGIFWVALQLLGTNETPIYTTEEFREWFVNTEAVSGALEGRENQDFTEAVETARENLPRLSEWTTSDHEVSLGQYIATIPKKELGYADILRTAVDTIVALTARGDLNQSPYGNFTFPENYFVPYPINLISLNQHASETWKDFSLEELLAWVAADWGIESHLRVALRKLRRDGRDTFQIRPTDQGLKVIGEPEPIYTAPRFRQAMQMLRDIGATERRVDSGPLVLTDLGHKILGEMLGS